MGDSVQKRPDPAGNSGGETPRNSEGETPRESGSGAPCDSEEESVREASRDCRPQLDCGESGGAPALLDVRDLRVSYPLKRGIFGRGEKLFNAVDGVSFKIRRGEILGLVGESGSGKTTTGRAIVRLAPISGGEIFYGGEEISKLPNSKFAPYRKKIQMIFQDPFNSLNPRMNIFEIISEPLDIHFPKMTKAQKRDRTAELLEIVGLESGHMARFPTRACNMRRARQRARRVRAGANNQPPPAAAPPLQPDAPVHSPRYRGRRVFERQNHGHDGRQNRRAGPGARCVRAPPKPIHEKTDSRRAQILRRCRAFQRACKPVAGWRAPRFSDWRRRFWRARARSAKRPRTRPLGRRF